MRAVGVARFGGPDAAAVVDVPRPVPGPDEVLVDVVGAAVNPVDTVTRAGVLAAAGLHAAAPVRLGWDVAGIVEAVGARVLRIRPGQRVVGLSDRLAAPSKTQAEFVALESDAVAVVPDDLDLVVAATLPLAGLTAEQALDELGLTDGQTFLVTGANGNVGSLAVQLARLRGWRVVAAAHPRHHDGLRRLGAAGTVDSRGDLSGDVRGLLGAGVDGVLDAAGLGVIALDAVRTAGVYVGLTVGAAPPGLRGVRSTSIAVHADWRALTVLVGLVASGALRLPDVRRLGLTEVAAAHRSLESGSGVRIVLTPRSSVPTIAR